MEKPNRKRTTGPNAAPPASGGPAHSGASNAWRLDPSDVARHAHLRRRSQERGRLGTAVLYSAVALGLAGAFASIYALTMTNPLTIVLYAGVFAGIGLAAGSSFVDAAIVTLAAWLGSTAWWVILCSIVGWARRRVSATALLWVNRISGGALVAFGVVAILGVLS